ncbi:MULTISPECIES: FecR family protein [Butyricimonas]|uniref:FecR family protein n=1 Tax=Butyricimonas TaxID=574697 RepID=UPI0022DE9853|nr:MULTISPECIES: FecR domain-containing protein [Butyricimonas]
MAHWDEIDEIAGKFLKKILLRDEKDSNRSTPEEDHALTGKYENWDSLVKESEKALKYDADKAFRKLRHLKYQRRQWITYSSVAASIIVMISLFFLQEKPQIPTLTKIEPGNKKATLILSDGTSRDIRESREVIQVKDSKLQIDSSGLIVTPDSIPAKQGKIEYHTLSVPRGGEYNLTLSDGTQVWLNSESELHFPTHFDKHNRMVSCKGEVYFDVSHNPQAPFVVKLTQGEVTVLGTEFCTSDYNTDKPQVTLVEGKVRFNTQNGDSVVLTPSQHLVYDAITNQLSIQKVDTRQYTAWKDNLFCFEDETLEDIMSTLSRWYNIEIDFESDELKQRHFSGTIEKYAKIESFLELFETGTNIKFDIYGHKIIIRQLNK